MFKQLNKYQQLLICFFTGLLFVVFSSAVFAKQPQTSGTNVVNSAQQQSVLSEAESSYKEFAASHLAPNFYQ